MKTQRSSEGIRAVGEEAGGELQLLASAWTWNLRTFWFSMRKRRRAEIHFWGAKHVGGEAGAGGAAEGAEAEVVDEEGADEMPTHHFQMRWPAAVGSGVPRMCLQCVQRREVGDVCVGGQHVRRVE